MSDIIMTPEEQLPLLEFLAIHGAYGLLANGDFANYEDTQKAIRLASNTRILAEVAEHASDSVTFADIRNRLLDISDPLVTRWKMLLPAESLEDLEKADEAFRKYAQEQLEANGLDSEEAAHATAKIIPFPS